MHTLILYYSGHGSKGKSKSVDEEDDTDGDEDHYRYKGNEEGDKKSDSDEDDKDNVPYFLIGEKWITDRGLRKHVGVRITDKRLRKLLTPFTKTSILVIMDCCYAARYKVLPEIRYKEPHPQIFRVQFNGTGSSNAGLMNSRIKSLFTCCLLRAMEGGFMCPLNDYVSKCKVEVYFQRSVEIQGSGYISLGDCHRFITQHLKLCDVDSNVVKMRLLDDVVIARYRDTPLGVFKYDIRGLKGILNTYQLQDIHNDMFCQLWLEIGKTFLKNNSIRRR